MYNSMEIWFLNIHVLFSSSALHGLVDGYKKNQGLNFFCTTCDFKNQFQNGPSHACPNFGNVYQMPQVKMASVK